MVQGKFTLNLGEESQLEWKEKGYASAHTTNKLYVKKREEKRKEKNCVVTIRSKAN